MSALPRQACGVTQLRGFSLRRSVNGNWIVEGPDNRCGGIFIDERAARDFIEDEKKATQVRPSDRPAASLLPVTPRRRARQIP